MIKVLLCLSCLLGIFASPAAAGQFEVPFRDAIDSLFTGYAPPALPSEESLNAQVIPGMSYDPVFSAIEWEVPSASLPSQVTVQASNNCVAIGYFEGRLYLAWRTGPVHFASREVQMNIISSPDWGRHWDFETMVDLNSDLREPMFTTIGGKLVFSFFQAGVTRQKFEPRFMWRMVKLPGGGWSPLETWGQPTEITWDIKVRNHRAWRTSYLGDHYQGNSGISLFFTVSDDGLNWAPANPGAPYVYHGGDSESSVEFLNDGTLWGVTRNEDGDASGFGSQLVTAPADAPGKWEFPDHSDPERYDSPKMFKHGDDLYLIARRDIRGPFDKGFRWLPPSLRKYLLWAAYGLRPKRTALYRIDREARRVVTVLDLPSDGDTSFPSVLRIDADTYLVANYTSPLRYPNRDWVWGQVSPTGTRIYFTLLRFVPRSGGLL